MFTKGPVEYEKSPRDGAHDACELHTSYDVQHTPKLRGPSYLGVAYSEGDARLWSAAPDLYEACKAMLNYLEESHDVRAEVRAVMARAAIAKAVGQ